MTYVSIEFPCGRIGTKASDDELDVIRKKIDARPDSATTTCSEGLNNFGKHPGIRLDMNIQSGKCIGCAEDDLWNCKSGFIADLLHEIARSI
jgi:hypothetical protein